MTLLTHQLTGTWELQSRSDVTLAGESRVDAGLGPNPIALLFFDRAGNFAAQFMKRNRPVEPGVEEAKSVPNNSRATHGYDAYFGKYRVDEKSGMVATTLIGALAPENVGQVFNRLMLVEGDQLTIRLETTTGRGEPIVRTLVWKRTG